MAGCAGKGQIRVETIEVPVQQFIPLEPVLVEARRPAPLPDPGCKDGNKRVSCVSQLIDWIEDEWCPTVRAHNCDKALIRCTQPTPEGERPDPGSVMRCVTRAGATECTARCGTE